MTFTICWIDVSIFLHFPLSTALDSNVPFLTIYIVYNWNVLVSLCISLYLCPLPCFYQSLIGTSSYVIDVNRNITSLVNITNFSDTHFIIMINYKKPIHVAVWLTSRVMVLKNLQMLLRKPKFQEFWNIWQSIWFHNYIQSQIWRCCSCEVSSCWSSNWRQTSINNHGVRDTYKIIECHQSAKQYIAFA